MLLVYIMYKILFRFTSLNSALTPEGIATGIAGLSAVKCGHVVTLNAFNTDTYTVAADGVVFNLPESLRPFVTVDFRDTFLQKRFQLFSNGNLVSKEALNSGMFRFTITYLAP